MCTEYYFNEWNKIIRNLKEIAETDLLYQTSKLNEKQRCLLARRLGGILGEYCSIYESVVECHQQVLQVQKTKFLRDILQALVDRILELKKQLSKLEASNYQFLGNGLISHLLTMYDAELETVPFNEDRPENFKDTIKDLFQRVRIKKEEMAAAALNPEPEEEVQDIWWEEVEEEPEVTIKETEEERLTREAATLIQAQERARKITLQTNMKRLQREKWRIELTGETKPKAPLVLRNRAASFLQQFFRAYSKIKRQKLIDQKEDEILGISTPVKPSKVVIENPFEKQKEVRLVKRKKIYNDWQKSYEDTKAYFLKLRKDDCVDDFKDTLRYWFQEWYKQIRLFPESIPPEYAGGSRFVFTEEAPTPQEYLEINNALLMNRGKKDTNFEKKQRKNEAAQLKKEERMKKKMEEKLLEKLMKNPSTHPGYTYPESMTTEKILLAIETYNRIWSELDYEDGRDVKVGFIKSLDLDNIWEEIRDEARKTADEIMREELKALKEALKKDYEANEEKMPEQVKQKYKKKKGKKHKVEVIELKGKVLDMMEYLAMKDILLEYPKTNLDSFCGEFNFIGDDYRCMLVQTQPYPGELKQMWWEKCQSMRKGFQRLILVGPNKAGKTVLVHGLATLNDAVLFELDPAKLLENESSSAELNELIHAVVTCARSVQPSVIYLRNVQKIFCKKPLPEDAHIDKKLCQQVMINKLCKKIKNTDKITFIGSCTEPWLTKDNLMMKSFPSVILLPDLHYTDTVKLIHDWMAKNSSVPKNLQVQPLAQVLQGYSHGFLKTALEKFLSSERLAKIAAFGIDTVEMYDFVREELESVPVNYNEYLEWYFKKTTAGINEVKDLNKEREMRAARELYEEKMRQKAEKEKKNKK